MPEFVLHILKMNLIAAVILLLTELFPDLAEGDMLPAGNTGSGLLWLFFCWCQ